jgi:hypothetical protein
VRAARFVFDAVDKGRDGNVNGTAVDIVDMVAIDGVDVDVVRR